MLFIPRKTIYQAFFVDMNYFWCDFFIRASSAPERSLSAAAPTVAGAHANDPGGLQAENARLRRRVQEAEEEKQTLLGM